MPTRQVHEFIADHFERLINQGDLGVIAENVRDDYVDHDGPGGRRASVDQARDRTAASLRRLAGLHVELRDIVAEGDRVVVRNVWTATGQDSGERIEMHGMVMFRIEDGKLAERWAMISDAAPLTSDRLDW